VILSKTKLCLVCYSSERFPLHSQELCCFSYIVVRTLFPILTTNLLLYLEFPQSTDTSTDSNFTSSRVFFSIARCLTYFSILSSHCFPPWPDTPLVLLHNQQSMQVHWLSLSTSFRPSNEFTKKLLNPNNCILSYKAVLSLINSSLI
jgi:hypothetical protein